MVWSSPYGLAWVASLMGFCWESPLCLPNNSVLKKQVEVEGCIVTPNDVSVF